MSLDVTLYKPEPVDAHCYHCNSDYKEQVSTFSANITHNLSKMASEAGIYEACWRPEEINVTKAEQLIPLLEDGLDKLLANPDYYKKFDSPNGWGKYEHFVPWVREYLQACKENPECIINISR